MIRKDGINKKIRKTQRSGTDKILTVRVPIFGRVSEF
jgi:hypothetical protein